MPYWSYGLQQVELLARSRGIALAVLPADGRPDARLDAASTMPAEMLQALAALCDQGGANRHGRRLRYWRGLRGSRARRRPPAPPCPLRVDGTRTADWSTRMRSREILRARWC